MQMPLVQGCIELQRAVAARAQPVRERLLASGSEPIGTPPSEFAAYVKSEIAKWDKVVRQAGVKPE